MVSAEGLPPGAAEFAAKGKEGASLEAALDKTVSFSREEKDRILAGYQAGDVIEGGDVMRYNPDGTFTQLRLVKLEGSDKVAVVARERGSEDEPSVIVFGSEWDAQEAITDSGNEKFDWGDLILRARGGEKTVHVDRFERATRSAETYKQA